MNTSCINVEKIIKSLVLAFIVCLLLNLTGLEIGWVDYILFTAALSLFIKTKKVTK
jgi:hypothetical protein